MNLLAQAKHKTGLAGACLLMMGLCFSNAFISIGIFMIFIQPFLNQRLPELWESLRKSPMHILLLVFFLANFLSVFYTSDFQAYLHEVKLKLPLLLIPIGMLDKELFKTRNVILLISIFIVSAFGVSLLTGIHYLLHREEINRMILASKPIPVFSGVNHIYFSIMLAFAAICGILFLVHGVFENKSLRIITWIVTVANIFFLHTISARTGLLGFYFALGALLLYIIVLSGKYLLGIIGISGIVILLVLAVTYVQPLNLRLQNTREDISHYLNDDNPNYWSITMRLIAWERTLDLIRENPVLGVGAGDLDHDLQKVYTENKTLLIPENRMGPHNQYLETWVCVGLAGLALLLAALILSLRNGIRQSNLFDLLLTVIFIISMFFESILERQIGISFFGFFMVYLNDRRFLENFLGKFKSIRDLSFI